MKFNFDASKVEPAKPIDVMPAGDYLSEIVEAEVAQNSSKNGTVLKITEKIIEPQEFKGRKVYDTINVSHESHEAERIGQAALSALQHSIGKIQVNDTNELLNIVHCIRLKIEKDPNGKYSDKNRISAFMSRDKYKGAVGAYNTGAGAAPFGGASQSAATSAAPNGLFGGVNNQQVAPQAAQQATAAAAPPPPPPPINGGAIQAAAKPWDAWQKSPDGYYALDPSKNDWVAVNELEAAWAAQSNQANSAATIKGPWNQ